MMEGERSRMRDYQCPSCAIAKPNGGWCEGREKGDDDRCPSWRDAEKQAMISVVRRKDAAVEPPLLSGMYLIHGPFFEGCVSVTTKAFFNKDHGSWDHLSRMIPTPDLWAEPPAPPRKGAEEDG